METLKMPVARIALPNDQNLRVHLVNLIRGGNAFMTFDKVVEDIPYDQVHLYPDDLPYTIWQQIKHLEFAQLDILDFCRNPDYKEPAWPEEYWPKAGGPSSEVEWHDTITKIKSGQEAMIRMIEDPGNDLFDAIPHGNGQTLFREAMLIAEHIAYHIGQIVIMKRLMGIYQD